MRIKSGFLVCICIFLGVISLIGCIPVKPILMPTAPVLSDTPSLTPKPTATIRSTVLPEPTVPSEPTRPTSAPVSYVTEDFISPDGNWKATIDTTRVEINKNRDLLNIVFLVKSTDGKTVSLIDDSAAIDQPLEGYIYPYVFKWSNDGKSLFYSHISTGGDGCFVINKPGGSDLKRLDLNTGDTITLVDGATYMALSPQESLLAYNKDWGSFLTIKDLNSLVENDYFSPAKTIGNIPGNVTDIIWSPDGNYLAYTFIGNPCDFPAKTSVVLMDVRNRNSKILIDVSETDYYTKEFLDTNTILMVAEQTGVPAAPYLFNILTGEITPFQ